MGLRAYILKSRELGDCSNGGISGHCDVVTLVNVEGPFEPTEEAPAALLIHGNLRDTVKIVPAVQDTVEDGDWFPRVSMSGGRDIGPMFGGCYVATSDSRFGQAVERLLGHRYSGAVALHDRFETQEDYDALSR